MASPGLVNQRAPIGQWRSAQLRYARVLRPVAAHIVIGVGGFLMLVPFLWLISASLKEGPWAIFVIPPEIIPKTIRWENYVDVFVDFPFPRFVRNTLIVTVPATLGGVLTSALAAYGFARLRIPGREIVFTLILATIMLPYAVTLIPVYIMFKEIGWLGTFLPLIVPYWFGGSAFSIFLLRQFFRTIPNELEDAAIIDGAGYLTIFLRIILPLSVPALVVVTIFNFLSHWNDYLGPLIYLNHYELWTIAIGIVAVKRAVYGQMDNAHITMAMSMLMVLPIVMIFFVAQRAFIRGIVLTGMKG